MNHVSLKSMAEDKSLPGVSKVTSFRVDPRIIEVEPGFNLRIEGPELDAHITGLKEAIKSGAVLPPIELRVEGGRTILIDGHCRHRATMELIAEGEEILDMEARHFRGNDAERVAHMLGSANGKHLTPLEKSHGYQRLLKFGWTVEKIAQRDGKTAQWVRDCVVLVDANTDVQQMVASGEVATKVAIKAVKQHGSEAGKELGKLVEKAKASGATRVTAKTVSGGVLERRAIERNKVLDEAIEAIMGLEGYSTLTKQAFAEQVQMIKAGADNKPGKVDTRTMDLPLEVA